MLRALFLLFLIVPIIEIYLLIEVGSTIGAMPTVLLVVGTALLGAVLLRFQGIATLFRVQTALARGELPTVAMFEGVILLLSGALLLTPGFFTDTLGFIGLIPPLRQWGVRRLLQAGLQRGVAGFGQSQSQTPPQHSNHGPRTLDGEYRREDD